MEKIAVRNHEVRGKEQRWRDRARRMLVGILVCMLALGSISLSTAEAKSYHGKDKGRAKISRELKRNVNQLLRINFRDMHEASWALPVMQQMRLWGIINGYPDHSFRPNKPVTREEAVVMAVRFLGLEDEALSYNADNDVRLPFSDANKISPWARGYIQVALEEDIIDDSGKFDPHKPAKRAWVAELAVRSMVAAGELNEDILEAAKNGNRRVAYVDLGSVDGRYHVYIVVATERSWVRGYPNRTFQGNKPVTRAEILTIFGNIDDTTGFFSSVRGELVRADDDEVTLKIGEQNKTYDVHEDALIYVDGRSASLDDLRAGMRIKAHLIPDGDIIYIVAKSVRDDDDDEDEDDNQLITATGSIKTITNNSLTLTTKDGSVSYAISSRVRVTSRLDGSRKTIDYDELRVGDRVNVTVEDGRVTAIELTERTVVTVEGAITGLTESSGTRTIVVAGTDGKIHTETVRRSVTITLDGESASFADLRVGQIAELTWENDELVRIDAQS